MKNGIGKENVSDATSDKSSRKGIILSKIQICVYKPVPFLVHVQCRKHNKYYSCVFSYPRHWRYTCYIIYFFILENKKTVNSEKGTKNNKKQTGNCNIYFACYCHAAATHVHMYVQHYYHQPPCHVNMYIIINFSFRRGLQNHYSWWCD